jgi:hypothetical protein
MAAVAGATGVNKIAQYTAYDVEITDLMPFQQSDYAFYIFSNPDPNSNQQLNHGMNALKTVSSPMNLMDNFTNKKKLANIGVLITTITVMLCIITFVGFVIVYIVFEIRGDGPRRLLLLAVAPVIIGVFIVILLLNLFYGRVLKEIMRAYLMLKK